MTMITDHFKGAPLGQLIYDRTYARATGDGRKETWDETVSRVVDGNLAFVDPKYHEPGERALLYDLILNRQMIPAGRHLWVTGVPGRQFVSNCHVAGFETGLAEHAAFCFSELMKGGGVGANYSSRYLSALTPLSSVAVRFICSVEHADFRALLPLLAGNDLFDSESAVTFRVPDSREGWVAALELLINEASRGGGDRVINFDVSDVRPRGSLIRGFGGISAGPLPLVRLLRGIADLLPTAVTPQTTMKIDHLIASAVIAGNVRRSARMSIMHWNDPAVMWFLNCKADHLDHWSTNISIEVDDEFFNELCEHGSHASYVYEQIIDGMMKNGEPGFYNSSLASVGERIHLASTNPCGELPLESWEACNLGHVNLAYGTDADHETAFRLMARFLSRASFSDIQDPKQQEVVHRNRRIGVGFFGLQEWLGLRGIPYSQFHHDGVLSESLTRWYDIVRSEANRYADQLGVNRPIKVTTIAPTGTIAKLAGTSEGMQPIYAKYYIRRVRYSENDPEVANLLAKAVPVEPCIYTPGTVVASFPCEDPIVTRVPLQYVEEQHEISANTLMELQVMIQQRYADNAISLTINVPLYSDEHSARVVRGNLSRALRKSLPRVKGTTVFPEASRPQSPIERITKAQYMALVKVSEINAGTSEILLEDCAGGSCPVR